MPSWNDLLEELTNLNEAAKAAWLRDRQKQTLQDVSGLRDGRNVIFYASGFLQKPTAPGNAISVDTEDINAFMSVIHGMDCSKGLTLLLHTPGGATNATETIVAYLRTKFVDIEVIVPTLAMSAGTMISLSADRIVMGRQSQLGPIDPQLFHGGRLISAQAVVEEFDSAKGDILTNQALAHLWAPILQSQGPALLQESRNALQYGESMVALWLERYMLKNDPNRAAKAKSIAHHFNDATAHKSHGRRIDRDEARQQGVMIEDLETNQDLQDAVLTAYHVATLIFQSGPAAKLIVTDVGKSYVTNLTTVN